MRFQYFRGLFREAHLLVGHAQFRDGHRILRIEHQGLPQGCDGGVGIFAIPELAALLDQLIVPILLGRIGGLNLMTRRGRQNRRRSEGRREVLRE